MTTKDGEKREKEEKPPAKGGKGVTFLCKFCGQSKPIDEMGVLTRLFPPLILCRDCEKDVR